MSRIGYKPIPVPNNVQVDINGHEVVIKGPQGTLTQSMHPDISIIKDDGMIKVDRPSDEREHRALHGLVRSLVANMVTGVSQGYVKSLELVGVGYRVQQTGVNVTLSLMMSHTVEVEPLPGLKLEVEGNNRIHVRGIDKQVVGEMAARIRALRPPNAYTGKGVRYLNEQIRLKPGKSARRT